LQPTMSNGWMYFIYYSWSYDQPDALSTIAIKCAIWQQLRGWQFVKTNGKPCILWYDIKRVNKAVESARDGLCKAAVVLKSQVLWWWLAWTIWPSSGFRVRHGTQILQRIRNWNEFKLVVWNARKD
jgi:hypothetical protein